MKMRGYMVVNDCEPQRFMLYVLVENENSSCAVYMRSFPKKNGPLGCSVSELQLSETVTGGGKVQSRDIHALPFKIPSDLIYR